MKYRSDKYGNQLSALGFGLMRLPSLDRVKSPNVDMEQLKKMVDLFISRGFTYFDTAWMYCGFASEPAAKEALVSRYPRDSFTLATKLHAGFLKTEDDRDRIFFSQLEKTGVEYFDYYLLHGIEAGMLPTYEKLDCFNWLLEKKAAGLVKHAGFSFHDKADLLDEILTKHPEMEFVQLQINYLDWESEWVESRKCYEVCVKHNKPVFVMEPVKGGTLANLPAEAEALVKAMDPQASASSWAVRFAASLPGVEVVLSGMTTLEQMEDNSAYMQDFKPLTEDERQTLFKVAEIINSQIAIPCTGCAYCVEGCPMNIAIPQVFSMYNEDMRENLAEKGWTINFTNYELVTAKGGKASECIACGQCEAVCPQHLPIIENLKQVAAHYER